MTGFIIKGIAVETRNVIERDDEMGLMNSQQNNSGHFSLLKYFIISSIGFFIVITIVLGLVFINYQKHLLTDYAISTAEQFAYQVSTHMDVGVIRILDEEHHGPRSIKESPNFQKLDRTVRRYMREFPDIVKIKIFGLRGHTVYSTDPENIGILNTHDTLQEALGGKITSDLTRRLQPLEGETTEAGKTYEMDLLEIYIPLYKEGSDIGGSGNIIGAFEIYKDVSLIFSKARAGGTAIFMVFTMSMLLLFAISLKIVSRADGIIKRQNEAIKKYNTELEEAQQKITESIDEVIKHGSFHVRYVNRDLAKCWEVKKCNKTDCPSYKSKELRCWQKAGTFCGGEVQGLFAAKYGDCRKCDVYKHAFSDKINTIGESFNNMMALLQYKHMELEEMNIQLNILVDIDSLTQIGNRRNFQNRIEKIHLHSVRYNRSYSIIVCDIDNFKLYNDTYGHQMGDYILVAIANSMKSSIRKTDEIFRWGGEEFVVILPEQGISDALKVAETLRANIEALGIEHSNNDRYPVVTISCGVSSNVNKHVVWESVLKQADDALYEAKASGRNCVCSSPDTDYKL